MHFTIRLLHAHFVFYRKAFANFRTTFSEFCNSISTPPGVIELGPELESLQGLKEEEVGRTKSCLFHHCDVERSFLTLID